ncbi:FecR family protein [Azonexus hydrophilus]|jgi:hypothetical protein|uniref:FecR family protein n=1 Tax=Azonexus hydrophilus TaxID=418702 RepID=UPI001BBE9352|nr:FecR family protein [Azonexus hydrophilus]MBS4019778.1 FecR domain-containing protein [Dechloromonas sp.]
MRSLPGILLAFALLCAMPLAAFASAADIVFASGGARVIGADQSVRPATRGMSVAVSETVDAADGMVQLRFRDGGTISLRPGTQFKVEQFQFTGKEGKASVEDRVSTRLLKGSLRALSGLIGKERHEQYEMKTSVGTIGIRGTEFGATLDIQGLRVVTYAGIVEVCNDLGCERIGPGQSLIVRDAGTRPAMQTVEGSASTGTADVVQELALPQPSQQPPVLPQQTTPGVDYPTHGPATTGP